MILYSQIDNYFEQIYKELDIPENYYEKANTSYISFTRWLDREESSVREYEPEIFLQGSFKLGTVIRPIGENGSYDIDMVCKFNNLTKQLISQKDLKRLIGEEVISYAKSKGMVNKPKDGKRCWTLNYHDEAKFHMDILPCVNDSKSFIGKLKLYEYANSTAHTEKAVAITDKRSLYYEEISDEWEISNPQGYYLWFLEKSQFVEKKQMVAKKYQMKTEDLKDYKVKTPLQKCIQILKRHRDIMFENNQENKPSSIIITTLAAKAYDGNSNIKDVLKNIVDNMLSFIEVRDDEYYVVNPVNPLENFADKWNENINKKHSFDSWIKELKKKVTYYNENIQIYGTDFIREISNQLGIPEEKALSYIPRNAVNKEIATISHRQKPKWRMRNNVSVYVVATKRKKGFSLPKRFTSGAILSKDTKLKFEAKAENIKQYDVYWQITNTGNEARSNNCLRGDFYGGEIEEGKRIRREDTMYTGSHIVECYLIKSGECYGKSEPFIVNISDRFVFEW